VSWDRASTLNDKLQHPLPRFPPNALVVHISIAATRTLDDYTADGLSVIVLVIQAPY
jgi:hypothetical protein